MAKTKKHPHRRRLILFYSLALFTMIGLTVSVLVERQSIQNYAQPQTYVAPPLFGCLHTGESDETLCGTKLGEASSLKLTMHDRQVGKTIVYYGDRLTGTLSYTNTADLPISIQTIGIAAAPGNGKRKPFDADRKTLESGYPDKAMFLPQQGPRILASKQSYTLPAASYRVTADDPAGVWSAGTNIVSNGQIVPVEEKPIPFTVNSTCTALRVLEMSTKDKANAKAMCGKDSKSKLCSSRQYCEIIKGENCTQKNVSEPVDHAQCDQYIIVEEEEQAILEEYCGKYPNGDICKDFCLRSIGASSCPVFYLKDVPESKFGDADPKGASKSAIATQTVAGVQDSAVNDSEITAPGACVNGGAGYASCGRPAPAAPRPAAKAIRSAPIRPAAKAIRSAPVRRPVSAVGRVGAAARGVAGRVGGGIRGGVLGPILSRLSPPAPAPPPPPPPPPPVTRDNAPNYLVIGGTKRLCALNSCHNATRTACSPSYCVGGNALKGALFGAAGPLLKKAIGSTPPRPANPPAPLPPADQRKIIYAPPAADEVCYTTDKQYCAKKTDAEKGKLKPYFVPSDARDIVYLNPDGTGGKLDPFDLKKSGDTCDPSKGIQCASGVCVPGSNNVFGSRPDQCK